MNKHEIAFEFQKALKPLVAEQFLTNDGAHVVLDMFIEHLDKFIESNEKILVKMIKDWEVRLLEDDTLYSLGLRHALDVLAGEDPKRFFTEGTGVSEDNVS